MFTPQQLIEMDPEIRAFCYFWKSEHSRQQLDDLGQLLGASFTVADIKSWRADKSGGYYDDKDRLRLPLALSLRPELREGLLKMVGGMVLPKDFVKGENEVVVDLGRTTPQEFQEFIEKKRIDRSPREDFPENH